MRKFLNTPESVFTPRESKVNPSMYVDRPEFENRLKNALRGNQHTIIHGESGTGKSWLYKKVLSELDAHVTVLNLANAARLKSISAELENILSRSGHSTLLNFSETKSAEANTLIAKGGLGSTKTYSAAKKEPFEACCEFVRAKAGDKLACIVLDNLESIFDSKDLMDELANIIILADDERYAEYKIKVLIVGVPTGIRDYFSRTPNKSTVANRLYELPEVGRLTKPQSSALIRKGFETELGFVVRDDEMQAIVEHISWVTDRIPQRIHEYCLELARMADESDADLTRALLPRADRQWLEISLSSAYSTVEKLMNERDTKIGRRNQTIYVLGHSSLSEFRYSDAEEMIRKEFPASTSGITMDLSTLLAHLASGETPILRRTPKGDSFQFVDPKYRMCIRAMMRKNSQTEAITKVSIGHLSGENDSQEQQEKCSATNGKARPVP